MSGDQSYAGKSAYKGEVAINYERDRASEPVWRREQAWMEQWARGVPAGARILDLPAGTGRFVDIFRARGATVHAVDVSEDMLSEVRRRFPDGTGNLLVERHDAEALPYPADTFDFVVCWRFFHLLPPAAAERVVRQFARVCRGRTVIEVFGVEVESGAAAWFREVRRRLATSRKKAKRGAPPWAHITNYAHRETDLLALFARCRLQVTSIETLDEYRGQPARVYQVQRSKETVA